MSGNLRRRGPLSTTVEHVERRKRGTHRRRIDDLAAALRRLGGGLLLHHQSQAEKLGLNPTDARAMGFLAETGPIPAGRLAELMDLTTGAITGVLDHLESAGLVRRESDPEDRRRVLVVPSDDGKKAKEVQRLFGPLARSFGALVRSYSEEELALILDFVRRTDELLRRESRGGEASARGNASAKAQAGAAPEEARPS